MGLEHLVELVRQSGHKSVSILEQVWKNVHMFVIKSVGLKVPKLHLSSDWHLFKQSIESSATTRAKNMLSVHSPGWAHNMPVAEIRKVKKIILNRQT